MENDKERDPYREEEPMVNHAWHDDESTVWQKNNMDYEAPRPEETPFCDGVENGFMGAEPLESSRPQKPKKERKSRRNLWKGIGIAALAVMVILILWPAAFFWQSILRINILLPRPRHRQTLLPGIMLRPPQVAAMSLR